MTSGTVKWFNERKGYGFIKQENGPDIFVHYTGIKAQGFKTLKEGNRVNFEMKQVRKGFAAVDVTVV